MCRFGNLIWNGEDFYERECEKQKFSLIVSNDNRTMAIRLENRDGDILWTSDFTFTESDDNNLLFVRLNRDAMDKESIVPHRFHRPRLMKEILRAGYGAEDNRLLISDKEVLITRQNINLAEDVICGRTRYLLPVVYVTKRFMDSTTILDTEELAKDLGALTDQIRAIREGSLTEPLRLSDDTDLKEAAENLNKIQQGMETALKEQTRSERMKVELVANVSHDIKTPLTSIISYVELLKQEEDLPEYVKEYVQILGEKSERLKTMVQDVFEISKAASNQLPVNLERLDLGKLLRQTLADMNAQISDSGLAVKTSIPEAPVMILADGQRLYRVFQNLIQNALQYSLEGSRIFLTLTDDGSVAVANIKNISGAELDDSIDFTERFVRGDESRTDGGSGLGLSIARSFTEACGGSFKVELNADLFTVTVEFPRVS